MNYSIIKFFKAGDYLIHLAIEKESGTMLLKLLEYGADINRQRLRDGWTALHLAAHKRSMNLVQTLVQRGADVSIVDKVGVLGELLHVQCMCVAA